LQKIYQYLGYKPGDFPESEKAQEEVLSLPMFAELTGQQVQEVVDAIKACLREPKTTEVRK
jgi:dTDP-4-amino-4,6-dideoxygalactose transaminase